MKLVKEEPELNLTSQHRRSISRLLKRKTILLRVTYIILMSVDVGMPSIIVYLGFRNMFDWPQLSIGQTVGGNAHYSFKIVLFISVKYRFYLSHKLDQYLLAISFYCQWWQSGIPCQGSIMRPLSFYLYLLPMLMSYRSTNIKLASLLHC